MSLMYGTDTYVTDKHRPGRAALCVCSLAFYSAYLPVVSVFTTQCVWFFLNKEEKEKKHCVLYLQNTIRTKSDFLSLCAACTACTYKFNQGAQPSSVLPECTLTAVPSPSPIRICIGNSPYSLNVETAFLLSTIQLTQPLLGETALCLHDGMKSLSDGESWSWPEAPLRLAWH